MFDILIRRAVIVDGSGRPAFPGDVGVRDGRIKAVGNLADAPAVQALDAQGLYLAPGFIDMHSHSDLSLLQDPRGQSKVRQGVTTELIGQCGLSPFPLAGRYPAIPRAAMESAYTAVVEEVDWHDLAGYAQRLERQGIALNVAPLVGHGVVRAVVMGYEDRPPTSDELEAMRRLVAEAMEQGAFGLSTGLTLSPGCFAGTDEIVALAKTAAAYSGIYDTHGRFWAGWHFRGAEEAVEIGRRAGIRVQIAHLALIDPRHWGEAAELAGILERASAGGVDVTFDVYPYVAAGSMLSEFLPEWVQEGGTAAMLACLRHPATRARLLAELEQGWFRGLPWAWDKIIVASPGSLGDPAWAGRSVQELADAWRVDPKEAFLRLIDETEDGVSAVMFNRTEEDMQFFLQHPLGLVGSDGCAIAADGPLSHVKVHPRYYGTFPRVLGHYVRERGLMPVEEAVAKMSGRPAARLGLTDRGLIRPGYIADLVLFDMGSVHDRATFEQPHQYPDGVPYVMVNGQWVVYAGEHTGALPGRVLRHR
ncbi:MAG: N-acyl-D-amino-acid deacylase family protein [Anaerolineae bacterium]